MSKHVFTLSPAHSENIAVQPKQKHQLIGVVCESNTNIIVNFLYLNETILDFCCPIGECDPLKWRELKDWRRATWSSQDALRERNLARPAVSIYGHYYYLFWSYSYGGPLTTRGARTRTRLLMELGARVVEIVKQANKFHLRLAPLFLVATIDLDERCLWSESGSPHWYYDLWHYYFFCVSWFYHVLYLINNCFDPSPVFFKF